MTLTFPFTNPENYSFDSDLIEFESGLAKLKELAEPNNVYVCYHLNASTGTTITDNSGNSRNGTGVNIDDTNWVAGKLNNCLYFNGVDEYIDTNFAVTWERTHPFSIEFWIKNPESDGGSVFDNYMSLPAGELRGITIYLASTGEPFIAIRSANANQIIVRTAEKVNDGNWHHLVFTYAGTSLASGVKIYIDGSLKTNVIIQDNLSATIVSTSNFNISSRAAGGVYLKAYIDELILYSEVISQTDVIQRYNAGSGTETPVIRYSTANPAITIKNIWRIEDLQSFIETATKAGSNEIKYIIKKATISYFWDGADWSVSDGTYTKASTASDINTNVLTFTSTIVTIEIIIFLHSEDGLTYPSIDLLSVDYDFGGETPDTINECIVFGYQTDDEGNISQDVIEIKLENEIEKYKDNIQIKRKKKIITPNSSEGYWEISLVESENMSTDGYYIFKFGRYELKASVPNELSKAFNELTFAP